MTRIALVTAAGGGICAEVARQLAAAGCALVLLDRDGAALAQVAGELRYALAADPLVVDATDVAAVEGAVQQLPARARADVLVNGVGGDTRSIGMLDLTEVEMLRAVQDNLVTAFTMMRLCVPAMVERRWGRVVNLASIAGRTHTHVSNAAYVAAKAALIGLTKQSAYELAPHGVCVNAVAHGVIATARVQAAVDARAAGGRNPVVGRIPAGRMGTIEEAAGAVVHLCGETAGYTTGAVVDVNGGLYI